MNTMLCQFNVETPMRDGVILRGDLYRPQEQGKFPLLLWRSIFRKNTLGRAFSQYDPAYFVQHGYAVFIQDVRGLGESDGEFDRFTADGEDGYDTIEWLAQQEYCNGNIGMIGNYYAGYLQLMAAAETPPHLKALCPMQTSVSLNRDCDNRGFMFYSHVGWCMSRQISRLRDGRYDKETTDKYLPMLLDYIRDYPTRQLLQRPLHTMPAVQNTPFPILKDYYKHLVEGYDNFDLIHKEGRDMDLSGVRTPAFYIAGWYDSSRTPLIDHCHTQRQHGVDSRVLIAPWKPGEVPAHADHALETGEITVDVQQEMLAWFDHWLKNMPAPAFKPYRYYDIATKTAWETDTWDDNGETQVRFYLQNGGKLGKATTNDVKDTYLHDPNHPLPFAPYGAGGRLPDIDAKRLYYTSDPVEQGLVVQGLVRVNVSLSSDAKDTDVVVRLLDIAPDGTTFCICDGATRARYRNSWNPEPLASGLIYPVEVLLGHVHYAIAPGHRVALEISGSAFPKYDINYGTGLRPPEDTGAVVSHNQIISTKANPSSVTLPLKKL